MGEGRGTGTLPEDQNWFMVLFGCFFFPRGLRIIVETIRTHILSSYTFFLKILPLRYNNNIFNCKWAVARWQWL